MKGCVRYKLTDEDVVRKYERYKYLRDVYHLPSCNAAESVGLTNAAEYMTTLKKRYNKIKKQRCCVQ